MLGLLLVITRRSGTSVEAPAEPANRHGLMWLVLGLLLNAGLITWIGFTLASTLLFVCTALVLFINFLVAGVFAVLGVLVYRGNQIGRIVTWCVIGIGTLCLGGGQITRLTSSLVKGPRAESAVPPWKWDLGTALDIATLIVLIVVAVLLVVPASNRFFRRPQD